MPRRLLPRIHRLTHRAIATVVAVSLLSTPVTYRGGAEAAHAHTVFQLWADVRSGSFAHHAGDRERGERREGRGPVGHHSPAAIIDASSQPGDIDVMSSGHPVMSSGVETSPPAAAPVQADHPAPAAKSGAAMDHAAMPGRERDPDNAMPSHPAPIDQVGDGAREPVKGSPTGTASGYAPDIDTAVVEAAEDAPKIGTAFTPSVRGTVLVLPAAHAPTVAEAFAPRVRQAVRLDGIVVSPTPPPPRQAA